MHFPCEVKDEWRHWDFVLHVKSCLGTGVSAEGSEGHGSHLLLCCPAKPAQQPSQIPCCSCPLVQILIAHQQLQSHLSATTRQGNSLFNCSRWFSVCFQKKAWASNCFIFYEWSSCRRVPAVLELMTDLNPKCQCLLRKDAEGRYFYTWHGSRTAGAEK